MKKFCLFLVFTVGLVFNVKAEVSFDAGVSVEKEAENSAIAKEEAMKDAYRQAFLNVAGRLTTQENLEKLNELSDEQIVLFITETNVVAEKSSKDGYRADLNIKINGDLLKEYMLENNMIEVVSAPADILLIPTYADMEYSGNVLFEDGNVWRDILLSKGHIKAGKLSFEVIEGTDSNKAFLTADNALNMSEDIYEKIKFINNSKNVWTVHAVRAGLNNVVLVLKPYGGEEKRIVVKAGEGDPFENAIEEMVSYIVYAMGQKNVDDSSYKSKINVVFEYQKLKDWLELQKKLNEVPQIKKIETGAMENGKVRFGLEFSGTLEMLDASLKENGLEVKFENGSYMIKEKEESNADKIL
ncbi:MAG TPA: hypothetical protein DIC64_04500 [Alphaproteobacteria bacterium]|nr:hypothetical protein [Alphaproteobacteria bacterium]